MPSFIIGGRSGGDLIISGNPWSGAILPTGGVQFRLDRNASGNAYIALSGKGTIQSGGFFQSGGGLMDGMQLGPGDAYFIPRIATGPSGNISIYATCDQAASGFARLYYELF